MKATQSIKITMTAQEAVHIMSIIDSIQEIRRDFLSVSDHEVLDHMYEILSSLLPLEMLDFEFVGGENDGE